MRSFAQELQKLRGELTGWGPQQQHIMELTSRLSASESRAEAEEEERRALCHTQTQPDWAFCAAYAMFDVGKLT